MDAPATRQPHFVRDYRRVVASFLKAYPLDDAMARAVGGGGYDDNGKIECDALIENGLQAGHSVIDVGCGSGRLSTQLSQQFGAAITYCGVDVVPELLDYARSKADPTYRFCLTEGLTIPAPDASTDLVVAFSVFTHLKHRETWEYICDAERALKPGGRLIFSFLELPRHRREFVYTIVVTLLGRRKVQNHFISRWRIKRWARTIGYHLEAIGWHPIGQSVAVLRKN
jgi:ubiquinone/menaquinone biosynthesis C-methylase UbiE